MKIVQRTEAPQMCYTYCLNTRNTHSTGEGSPGKVQQPPIRAAMGTMQGYTFFQARVRAPNSVASQVWSQDASCLETSSFKACLFSISNRYKPRSWWAPWLNANRGNWRGRWCAPVFMVSVSRIPMCTGRNPSNTPAAHQNRHAQVYVIGRIALVLPTRTTASTLHRGGVNQAPDRCGNN